MIWIGLTGCMGCGKSTVAQILKDNYGCAVVSADEVSHNVMFEDQELHEAIKNRWGIDFAEMNFDDYRKAIAEQVFGSALQLSFLESLLHPKIRRKVNLIKAELAPNHKFAFYDVPLLFEKNMEDLFDIIVGVFASEDVQIERIKGRNSWTDDEIQKRIAAQMPVVEKVMGCDFVIRNEGSLKALNQQVKDFFEKLKLRIENYTPST